jgi:DNA gyrase subunit A
MSLLVFHPEGYIPPKCIHCRKTMGYHRAVTYECPTGMKTRIGYTEFGPTRWEPKLKDQKMSKKTKKRAEPDVPPEGKIRDVDMTKFAMVNYRDYGTAVLEDRAIPDYRDGMNPVNRRALWSAHEMGLRHTAKYVKSARIVGDTMGKFHPHGDSSIYTAIIGMANTNSAYPLVDGEGSWGSMSDGRAAAMRYTEMRLSQFADEVLFNRFYLPVTEMSPNYDGSFQEPVLLPALLPVVLLNGRFGVAPGATAYIPSFTWPSVRSLLKKLLSGNEATPKLLYQTLEFTSTYGGTEVPPESPEDKQARLSVMKGTKGKVRLQSQCEWDEDKLTMTVTRFAEIGKMSTLLESIADIEGVSDVRDDSDKSDKYARLVIVLKKGLKPKLQAAIVKHIEVKLLQSSENYVLNFTERYLDEEGQAQATMKSMSLVEMMTSWTAWRIELERKACAHWIAEADKEIRRLELLMIAVDNRKVIIESLDKELEQDALNEWLAKRLKITVAEAAFIYDLRVRQLRKLERKTLEAQMKVVTSKRSELKQRRKNPEPHMVRQLDGFSINSPTGSTKKSKKSKRVKG